jgi:hypothetical protein
LHHCGKGLEIRGEILLQIVAEELDKGTALGRVCYAVGNEGQTLVFLHSDAFEGEQLIVPFKTDTVCRYVAVEYWRIGANLGLIQDIAIRKGAGLSSCEDEAIVGNRAPIETQFIH